MCLLCDMAKLEEITRRMKARHIFLLRFFAILRLSFRSAGRALFDQHRLSLPDDLGLAKLLHPSLDLGGKRSPKRMQSLGLRLGKAPLKEESQKETELDAGAWLGSRPKMLSHSDLWKRKNFPPSFLRACSPSWRCQTTSADRVQPQSSKA